MPEAFLERQLRRIETLEAAYDALPPAQTEIVIERRIRIVSGFHRAMKLAIQLDGMIGEAAGPQEDKEDGMRLRHDPETVERKQRLLGEGLDRLARHLEERRTGARVDRGGAGDRSDQLAGERQQRAA